MYLPICYQCTASVVLLFSAYPLCFSFKPIPYQNSKLICLSAFLPSSFKLSSLFLFYLQLNSEVHGNGFVLFSCMYINWYCLWMVQNFSDWPISIHIWVYNQLGFCFVLFLMYYSVECQCYVFVSLCSRFSWLLIDTLNYSHDRRIVVFGKTGTQYLLGKKSSEFELRKRNRKS